MNFLEFKNKYCKNTPQVRNLESKVQGWNSNSIALKHAIETTQPENIVEVGTWLGASALFMATQSQAQIICVDTFLGSNEILWRDGNVKNVTENFSQVYDQFCANITHSNANNTISPLPMTSSSAAELFMKEQVKVDMVYIDAGHREREVYADLQDWWPLTNKVLVGDDYNSSWSGVISAADRFASENNLNLQILDSKFLLFR
jgi:cephalosporin hydroxylase